MRLPGRPIIRKGGAVVAFVGGGLQPYRRPGTQQKTRPHLRAGLTHHMHQVRLGSLRERPAATGPGLPLDLRLRDAQAAGANVSGVAAAALPVDAAIAADRGGLG